MTKEEKESIEAFRRLVKKIGIKPVKLSEEIPMTIQVGDDDKDYDFFDILLRSLEYLEKSGNE